MRPQNMVGWRICRRVSPHPLPSTSHRLRHRARSQPAFPHRNFSKASVVCLGCSSKTQCPVSLRTTIVASVATIFICCPSSAPFAFSPPIARTGIVSLVFVIVPRNPWPPAGKKRSTPNPPASGRDARMPPYTPRDQLPEANASCPPRSYSRSVRNMSARVLSPALPASGH